MTPSAVTAMVRPAPTKPSDIAMRLNEGIILAEAAANCLFIDAATAPAAICVATDAAS